MTAKNDITGDSIQTKTISDAYRDNYDRIFGKKKDLPVAFDGTSDEKQFLRDSIDTAMNQLIHIANTSPKFEFETACKDVDSAIKNK